MQRQQILVVEDNATTRKYVRATLAAEGACVVEAETGSQALEALSHVPDGYRRYLEHFFRDAFQLRGTPLRIQFKTGANPYANSGR